MGATGYFQVWKSAQTSGELRHGLLTERNAVSDVRINFHRSTMNLMKISKPPLALYAESWHILYTIKSWKDKLESRVSYEKEIRRSMQIPFKYVGAKNQHNYIIL